MRKAARPPSAPALSSSTLVAPWATRKVSVTRLATGMSPSSRTSGTRRTTPSASGTKLKAPLPRADCCNMGSAATAASKRCSQRVGAEPTSTKRDFCSGRPGRALGSGGLFCTGCCASAKPSTEGVWPRLRTNTWSWSGSANSCTPCAPCSCHSAAAACGAVRSGSANTTSKATAAAPAALNRSSKVARRVRGQAHWSRRCRLASSMSTMRTGTPV